MHAPGAREPPSLGHKGYVLLSMHYRAVIFLLLNVVSAAAIVFANKAVFTVFEFRFIYALTLIHAITTALGMHAFCAAGMFEYKHIPALQVCSPASVHACMPSLASGVTS